MALMVASNIELDLWLDNTHHVTGRRGQCMLGNPKTYITRAFLVYTSFHSFWFGITVCWWIEGLMRSGKKKYPLMSSSLAGPPWLNNWCFIPQLNFPTLLVIACIEPVCTERYIRALLAHCCSGDISLLDNTHMLGVGVSSPTQTVQFRNCSHVAGVYRKVHTSPVGISLIWWHLVTGQQPLLGVGVFSPTQFVQFRWIVHR